MSNIDTMSVNAIRVLSADGVQKANSGHPGLHLVLLLWLMNYGQSI
jgi:transketolase